jgi:hypothetical protein
MPAHAQAIDAQMSAPGKPPFASRIATSILINSLTQGIASGIEPSDLFLTVLTPDGSGDGDDPGVVQTSLERLYKSAWYLDYDGHYYRFKTEPAPNKIIEDETAQVSLIRSKGEIDRRIRLIWHKGFLQPAYFPSEPGDVDDDSETPRLAIMHYDAVSIAADAIAVPDLVRRVYAYSGNMQSFRKFQNNLLFLVADTDQVETMVQVTRRYLAIGRIVGDATRMAEFNKEQREIFKKALDSAELDVRVAITKAYRYLIYPSQDAPKDVLLTCETLPAQDQGEMDRDQVNVLLKILRQLHKLQTADDEVLSAMYVKSRAWEPGQTSMSTEDLRKAFARKISLRILLDNGQLKKTIQNGVKTDAWVYYDAQEEFGYDSDSPPPAWRIADDALLYTPDEAARLEVRIKGKWEPPISGPNPPPGEGPQTCPVCNKPVRACTCGITQPTGKPTHFSGSGAVNQAFQQILDQCQEHGYTHLSRLVLVASGAGKQIADELHAIGLAIPQFGKGNYAFKLRMVASFAQNSESIDLTFQSGWERYKRLKSITDAFAKEADEVNVTITLGMVFEGGLDVNSPDFSNLRDILSTLGVGKISLDAFPVLDSDQ